MSTGIEAKLGQSLDDLIKSQKSAAKKTAATAKVRWTSTWGNSRVASPAPCALRTPRRRRSLEIPDRYICLAPTSAHSCHRTLQPQKKKTPSKGVKPAPKSKPKPGKKIAAIATPKGKKGVAIKVKKTPVSVKGGVKKGKGKATPMAIDSEHAVGGTRARRTVTNGKTKVVLVGGSGKSGRSAARQGAAQVNNQRRKDVKGETGYSINSRFERISKESKGPRLAPGKGSTNKFGVYMPF